MQNKKLVVKVAKEIRKNTKRSLPNSIQLAKKFLTSSCYEPNTQTENLGFAFEWVFDGIKETKMFQGIWHKDIDTIWEIPVQLYDMRKVYEAKRNRKSGNGSPLNFQYTDNEEEQESMDGISIFYLEMDLNEAEKMVEVMNKRTILLQVERQGEFTRVYTMEPLMVSQWQRVIIWVDGFLFGRNVPYLTIEEYNAAVNEINKKIDEAERKSSRENG